VKIVDLVAIGVVRWGLLQAHVFAFNLTSDWEPGVYVFESTLTAAAEKWTRYAEDFIAFLADAVELGAVWPRPNL